MMRQHRLRKSRSWSKDRQKPQIGKRRLGLKASICAFAGGAALVVFLWSRLQTNGVPGPWTSTDRIKGEDQGSLEFLRRRRDYLLKEIALADEKLAGTRVVPGARDDRSTRPKSEGRSTSTESEFEINVDGHYILELSPDEFATTSVDKMMARYDSRTCDQSFGNGLVDAWRQTGTDCCGGDGTNADSSSARCHLIHQKDHHGNGDNLVQMKNVQVDLSYFRNADVAKEVMTRYKQSKQSDQAYIHFHRGAVKGTCSPDPNYWQASMFPGWNADWTANAFETVGVLECDQWIEHPVMVVQRDTFANLFHDSEDFVNAFLAMSVLRKAPGDTQVWLTDLYPKGPFWSMWEKVFGVGHPTLTAWEVGKRYGEKKTCFRDLTIGIFGPAAPTTLARMVTPCFHTALVRAYSDFVIRGLGLQGDTSYASSPSNKVVVTWMARRSSVQWPERAFCSEDGKDSFFTCGYFYHLDKRELQRKVKNEAEVVTSLRTLEQKTFANGAEVEVRDVDYNLLSFEDQIKNDLETDIMIGPHGAGLFHVIFTPDRASLIELQIDQTTQRKHFANLARWSGHEYSSSGGPNPVHVSATKAMVETVVSRMDLSKH